MKQTWLQSEFSCLSEYTRLYPNEKSMKELGTEERKYMYEEHMDFDTTKHVILKGLQGLRTTLAQNSLRSAPLLFAYGKVS